MLIPAEMDWTQRFFQHKAGEWSKWRDLKANSPGHAAYAEQQISMWSALKEHSKSSFDRALK